MPRSPITSLAQDPQRGAYTHQSARIGQILEFSLREEIQAVGQDTTTRYATRFSYHRVSRPEQRQPPCYPTLAPT